MLKIDNKPLVVIDVDETLVTWEGTGYRPNKDNVTSLIRHSVRGHKVLVWSAGGVDWVEKVVKELGLEQYVDIISNKPSWYIDDQPADKWMVRYWYPAIKEEETNGSINRQDKEDSRDSKISPLVSSFTFGCSGVIYPIV